MKQELRLIVTQACNYRCYFCHREGIKGIKKSLLDSEDYKYLFSVANKNLGIETVTITGGEPLVLDNIEETAKGLYELGCDTTIVTNGSLLANKMSIGKYITKLNLSLHSLDKNEYEKIVGRSNVYDDVIKNIKTFRKMYPSVEINLNYALIKCPEINEKIVSILEFAKENKVNVKFIELFPKNCQEWFPIENLHEILIKNNCQLLSENNRKSKFSNGTESFVYTTKCLCSRALDFTSPSEFCKHNNDLFITQDASIKLCRLLDDEINIASEIKERKTDALTQKLKKAFEVLGDGCPYER